MFYLKLKTSNISKKYFSSFKKYHDKFKKCPNKQNYCKFITHLKHVTLTVQKIRKDFVLIQTDDFGVVIFNSNITNNTWENYKTGKIRFNEIGEIICKNLAERQNKFTILTTTNKHYFSLKSGSTTTGSTSNNNQSSSGNAQTAESVGIIIAVFFAVLLFALYFGGEEAAVKIETKIAEGAEEGEEGAEGSEGTARSSIFSNDDARILEVVYDDDGKVLYTVFADGTVLDSDGFFIGNVVNDGFGFTG